MLYGTWCLIVFVLGGTQFLVHGITLSYTPIRTIPEIHKTIPMILYDVIVSPNTYTPVRAIRIELMAFHRTLKIPIDLNDSPK